MREIPWFLLVFAAAIIVVAALTAGVFAAPAVFFVVAGTLVFAGVAAVVANDGDRSWLPVLLPLAFLVKMAGATARYYQVVIIYESGDAFKYHRIGSEIAPIWRSFEVPEVTGGGFGTQVTGQVTGLIYTLGVPSLIVSFMIFASLALVGMLLFYLAFRRTVPGWGALPYFVLLFFLPTMLFWPSSTGKDALIVLALGAISYGAALAFAHRVGASLVFFAFGLAISGLIRPHIPVIAIGSLLLAALLSTAGRFGLNRWARLALVALATVALVYLVPLASTRLGVDEGLETFLAEQQRVTTKGGSAVAGTPVASPLDLPEATLRVLFRPFPHEASSIGMLLSSIEGLALLALVLWRTPTFWANRNVLRRVPYLLYSLGFSLAFIIAFSSIFNFGILARQRSQVIPFLLAAIVGLGWHRWSQTETAHLNSMEEEEIPA